MGVDTWVHWTMNVGMNAAITHYIDGVKRDAMKYSPSLCGNGAGSLVLGQDQDNVGGGFDANQAPEVWFDSLHVYNGQLSTSEITQLASKSTCLARAAWSNWAFSTASDMGKDYGPNNNAFSIQGSVQVVPGVTA